VISTILKKRKEKKTVNGGVRKIINSVKPDLPYPSASTIQMTKNTKQRDYLPKGFFFVKIIWGTGFARVVFDFKGKDQIRISFNQLGSSYYPHKDIPFLIVISKF
jgi:hypothetical protein